MRDGSYQPAVSSECPRRGSIFRQGLSPQVLTRRASHDGACPRRAMLLASNDPTGNAATTGHVPVERCSSPATIPLGTPSRRGMSPSSDAPRQQRSRRGRRHDGACPRRALLPASNDSAGDAATTGHVPVERCSSPATIPLGTPPRRGMSPSSVAPRQQRSHRGRRHDGACPRRALLPAQQTALSGEELRYAGTSPAVAGICRLVAIRFMLERGETTPHCCGVVRDSKKKKVSIDFSDCHSHPHHEIRIPDGECLGGSVVL